jgi:uncharacterized phage-like protein YoqJ
MKTLITGHRTSKLEEYDIDWIKTSMFDIITSPIEYDFHVSYGLSGMASGVDLWFCQQLYTLGIGYSACIPFKDQDRCVENNEMSFRRELIEKSSKIYKYMRNSQMLEKANQAIVVWDGNKGGTHNVVQQLVEKSKGFLWINPVAKKIWNCT